MDDYGVYQVNSIIATAQTTGQNYQKKEEDRKKKKYVKKTAAEQKEQDAPHEFHVSGYGPHASKTELVYRQREYN